MLALDDAALARVMIAATVIAPHARGRWLEQLVARLDLPPTGKHAGASGNAMAAPITAKGAAPVAGRRGRYAPQ
jgi:hypothetical protein